jgi:hypothetical protein
MRLGKFPISMVVTRSQVLSIAILGLRATSLQTLSDASISAPTSAAE